MVRFNRNELERYSAHIALPEIGGSGQQKLRDARVLVIGAGGLGSPCILYLAAAGVGVIGVADDDRVELSNLQRQIIHDDASLGDLKVDSVVKKVAMLNSNVEIIAHNLRVNEGNIKRLIADYDIVVDGCDNFATRYLVSDECLVAEKPLVSAAVGQFDGMISTFKPYAKNEDGVRYPSYRDIFPHDDSRQVLSPCTRFGIIGALTGVLGALQAMEVLKEIVGFGKGLVGRLLLYDARVCRFEVIILTPLSGGRDKNAGTFNRYA